MYVNAPLHAVDAVSPFGSVFHVPQGFRTQVAVEDGYWLTKIQALEIEFESLEERATCEQLLALQELNPLRAIPKPQNLTPNATLQLDGYATRYPVIVVNPQGLLQDPVPEYYFQNPTVNLVVDTEALRQIVKQCISELTATPTLPGESECETAGALEVSPSAPVSEEHTRIPEEAGNATSAELPSTADKVGRGRARRSGATDEDI